MLAKSQEEGLLPSFSLIGLVTRSNKDLLCPLLLDGHVLNPGLKHSIESRGARLWRRVEGLESKHNHAPYRPIFGFRCVSRIRRPVGCELQLALIDATATSPYKRPQGSARRRVIQDRSVTRLHLLVTPLAFPRVMKTTVGPPT